MAFGNITTLYFPTAANAGASQWGTDVRKLLDSADAGSDSTTITGHGTGGARTRTEDPYTTSSADSDQTLFGWAVTPTDMNSVSGARRFYPAGDHVATVRMGHNGATGATGTITMYVYRVGNAAGGRARTLLGSNTASVVLPALSGEVTMTCTVALGEIVFEADETVQYSFEFNVAGIVIVGRQATFFTGTQSSVAARVDTPKLGVLADTTGTATGTAAASGASGLVLGTIGSATGTGAAAATGASTGAGVGSATGSAAVAGAGSSVAGTIGSASGTASATGLASIVLGTVGTVSIGADTPDWPATAPTKAIAGSVLHHETGAPIVGATVRLIRDTDEKQVQTDTAGALGAYSFARDTDDPYTYHVLAEYDDAGTQVHGVSDRGLIPA